MALVLNYYDLLSDVNGKKESVKARYVISKITLVPSIAPITGIAYFNTFVFLIIFISLLLINFIMFVSYQSLYRVIVEMRRKAQVR